MANTRARKWRNMSWKATDHWMNWTASVLFRLVLLPSTDRFRVGLHFRTNPGPLDWNSASCRQENLKRQKGTRFPTTSAYEYQSSRINSRSRTLDGSSRACLWFVPEASDKSLTQPWPNCAHIQFLVNSFSLNTPAVHTLKWQITNYWWPLVVEGLPPQYVTLLKIQYNVKALL